ncbi:hypothetical protein [Paenibacillus agricola]|uniref:Uncharacterized protein n=1 Tax=Paenibacillus agricola TaxID=2716264 RepID=A0ABX0JG21_9BACL|nr:hypothetical protein [Paenibacillus agricola]NHN34868.1 hypothetical protein [Paenibacillus agricola]
MPISPFSTENYKWETQYKVIESSEIASSLKVKFSKKELEVLKPLRDMRFIGSAQYRKIFLKGDKGMINQLIRDKKVLEHPIIQIGKAESGGAARQTWYFYTLGLSSLKYFDMVDEVNYWMDYKTAEVLQRFAFFKLFSKFISNKPAIYCSGQPFVGTIEMAEPIDILVVKENTREIQQEWRFRKPNQQRRIIVLTENINWLKPIEELLVDFKVRVVLESELNSPLSELFYKWNEKSMEWVKA